MHDDEDGTAAATKALEGLIPAIAVLIDDSAVSPTDIRSALLHLAASTAINGGVSREHFCAEAAELYDNMLLHLPRALEPSN